MYTEDDNKNIPAVGNTPYDRVPPEQPAVAENRQDAPVSSEPVIQSSMPEGDKVPPRQAYYEPWQQPVNNEPGKTAPVYSPGAYSGASSNYQWMPPPDHNKPKKKRHFSFWMKAACLVLACALVSGATTWGVIELSGRNTQATHQVVLGATLSNDGAQASPDGTAPAGTMTSTSIYEMAIKQVVGVNSQGMSTNIFGQQSPSAVSGSGFIVSADGYIVTNYHVIAYAVEQRFNLTVMLHDGTSYPAKVIGYEKDNDVAVIKIDATGLNPVVLGSNKAMRVGDTVYAIGNPLGELDYSMTSGIVSALDRVIQVDETTSINMFQIDAAVNSGNSGGPVYSAEGKVIGIVSAKYSSAGVEGLGFAIPIDDAMDIVTQLIETGHISGKPSMGISVRDVTQEAADYYNMHVGAYVVEVQPGSAADKAGIQMGDIIIKLGDQDVTSADTLKLAKKAYKAGNTATIVVFRDGKEVSLQITFTEEGITATSAQTTPTPQSTPSAPTRGAD
jgi:serine protease Do